MSKFCSHCGNEVPEDALYCPFCGRSLLPPEARKKVTPPPEQKSDAEQKKTTEQKQTDRQTDRSFKENTEDTFKTNRVPPGRGPGENHGFNPRLLLLIPLIFLLFIAIRLLWGFIREPNGHQWVAATCTEPKTCSICGKTEGEPLDHTWAAATCTEPKTCVNCGKTEGAPLGHTWNAATCTTPKTCAICGKTEGTVAGHTWVAATCTDPKHCSVCGTTEGNPLGHNWVAATCTKPRHCSRCSATDGSPAGHDFAKATCTKPKTCKVCGVTEGTALGHDYKAATYDKPKTCKRCGATTGNVKGYVPASTLTDGHWSDKPLNLQDYDTYYFIFNKPLKKCRKLQLGIKLTDVKGNPYGKFGLYVRSGGNWYEVGQITISESNKEYKKTYTLNPARTIDAVMFEPLYNVRNQCSWKGYYYFYDSQVE